MKLRLTNLALAAAFLVLTTGLCRAQADLEAIKKNVPKLLGANNQGMEFVLGFFPTWVENAPNGAQVGIRLYFSSGTAAHVTVRVVSKGWEKNLQTVPNQVSEVFIPYEIAQVAGKKLSTEEPEPAQVYPGGAVTVSATAPIVCYGVVRYPYTADGYLAIPVTSLGKEYVVAGYNGPWYEPDKEGQYMTSYTAIVGAYDNTSVRFVYGGRANCWVPTLEGKKLTPGQEDTKILNKGDVWLVPVRGGKSDITGSYVEADKPVACFSGNFCANVPVQTPACDLVMEQDMPMHTWGRKYFVSPIKDRAFNTIVRLFASKDNVSIYRNGWTEQVATIAKKYGPEGEGWVEMRAAEGKPQPVTFLSHDRFNVVQFNPGAEDDGMGADPFEMSLIPIEQFQDHIAFNTPGVSAGMTFKYNFVNIIYKTTPQGKIPDDLEIGAADAQGVIEWKKVNVAYGAEPGFEFIDPTNPTPERKYYCKQITLPGDGVYHVRALDKFAAYAYGYFFYDSYGFPTSFATMNQGSSDLVKPELDFAVDVNGVVRSGSDNTQLALVRDPNLGLIYFDSENSYNYSFEFKPFVAGVDDRTEWGLAPIDATKDARAVVTFTDRNGNDTTVVIQHLALRLALDPNVKDYGMTKVGEMKTIPFIVTNMSKDSVASIENMMLKKGNEGFSIQRNFELGVKLAPGESRTFTITYKAADQGFHDDSIGVDDGSSLKYIGYVYVGKTSSAPGSVNSDLSVKVSPNPVDSRGGTIEFETAYDGVVELNLYNSANQLSAVLVNGYLKAGKHSIRIPIETLSSGSYTYQIIAGPFKAAEQMVIVK